MQYIGVKLVEAEPAMRIDGKIYPMNEAMPKSLNREPGYKVTYQDGYVSFCPKNTFEKANLPLCEDEYREMDAPSISKKMVDDFIKETHVQTVGDKTTIVRVVLANGFEIVEASSSVSAENYDKWMGENICMKKIKDKIWAYLGFLLQSACNGMK